MQFVRRACVFAALSVLPALAQQTIQSATLSGRVTDSSGAVMQGVRISALHSATGSASVAESDAEGRFRFPLLRPGTWQFRFSKPGFQELARSVELGVGAALDLPVTLGVEESSVNLTVAADAVLVENARSQIATNISPAEIIRLPLNGRNFLDLALLAPGVSPTNTASTQLFPETSAVAGQGISINSQRNFSNGFIVDGLSANDDAAGLSGIPFGVDAVQEFQVVTSGGQAEFGRALGGYVNLITKSGSNDLHADVYGYLRDQRMNAKNALSGTKLPMTQAQYGASAGGPLARNRTFAFSNFEQRRLNQSGLVTISPANVSAINARLAETGYKGSPVATGLYANPVDSTNLLARVDHQVSSRDQLSIRYAMYRVDSANSRGAGGLNAPSAAAGLDNTDHSVAISNVWTLSPRVVNETRAQFIDSGLAAEPADAQGPQVTISGVATFGRLSGSPTGRSNRLYEIVDNLSIQRGRHALRFGGQFLYNDLTITYPRQIRGAYTFSSLANLLSGVYNNAGFVQTFGNSVVPQTNPNAGFFAQDEWKLTPSLTINAGLRYDLQFLETIQTDRNNISPRLGLAWSPGKARRSVIRASWGLYYDRVPLRALANALLSSNNTTKITPASQISVSLSPTQSGAPSFPSLMNAAPASVVANFTTMDRHMQNAYSVQTSVEMERQIGEHASLSVGYQRLRGIHLIASLNQNPPSCVASGNNNGCRPNPSFANQSQYSPAADSVYDGLHVSFVQRPVGWGYYRISYTLSKSMNNVGEFFFSSPIDNYDIWKDWARSDDDQRHRVSFNGGAEWRGFRLGATLQYYSALPFNITTGSTTVQGTPARPLINGQYLERNAGTGFDRLTLNLRASRIIRISEKLRLEAIGEMFNVTNRVNGVALNGVFGGGAYPATPSAAFRQTTAVAEPRSAQVALRLSF